MFFKNDGLRLIIYLIWYVFCVIYIVCVEFEVLEDNFKNICLSWDKKKNKFINVEF